eukprot:scaffold3132_cov158-Amphora_coffeaeformis.AAC.3
MTVLERRKRRLQKAAWTLKNPVPKKKKPIVTGKPHPASNPTERSAPGWRKKWFTRRLHSIYNEPLEPLEIGLKTYRLMKAVVLDRISQGNGRSCTVFDAVEAIKSSTETMDSFVDDQNYSLGVAVWNIISRKEVRHMKLRYKLMAVLDEMEAKPSACDDRVSSWEEVEDVLREHLSFPEESAVEQEEITADDPIERMILRIDQDSQAKINLWIAKSQSRIQRRLMSDQASEESFMDETEKRAARLVSEELRTSEERLLQEEREAEAQERASQLLRDLTPEEQELVRNALFSPGPEDDIIAKSDTDFVTRKNMQTLQPGAWLSDEVIHFFLAMLAKRDEELCQEDSTRKRSHFFKSFFMTKLTNEGHQNPVIAGTYDYYIKDEHKDKNKEPLPDEEEWRLIPCERDTPRQRNGYDCGVFTCMFADFISKDCPLVFGQDHVNQCRERIALSILQGRAIM